MIQFEKEIINFLQLPSIPKKEWNGKAFFKKGVAVLNLIGGGKMYAVASNENGETRILKVFGLEPFTTIEKIFVVPNYMSNEEDIKDMDLDEQSKKRAEELLKEASEIENEGIDTETIKEPENEYFFDHITNDDEAMAYIAAYNKANKIKGRLPTTHEGLVMRLSVIFADTNKK